MDFFKHIPTIDFMGLRYKAIVFSALLSVLSVAALIINGISLSLDFTGGSQINLVDVKLSPNAIREKLAVHHYQEQTSPVVVRL